ncbi:MAG: hypothetical protein AAFS02_03170 [Pseudomonadota bacterium]
MNRRVLVALALIVVVTLLVYRPSANDLSHDQETESTASFGADSKSAANQAAPVSITETGMRDAAQASTTVAPSDHVAASALPHDGIAHELPPSRRGLGVLFRTDTEAFHVAFDRLMGVESPDSDIGLATTATVSERVEGLASDATTLVECGGRACIIDVWLTDQTILDYLEQLRQAWVPIGSMDEAGRSVELRDDGSYRIYTY